MVLNIVSAGSILDISKYRDRLVLPSIMFANIIDSLFVVYSGDI